MSIIFRLATAEDTPDLARAHVASWHAAYQGLVPDSLLDGFTVESRIERFHQSLESEVEETCLVEESGEVLGFITLGACRDEDVDTDTTGEIWGIYLAPEHWRQGIGSFLCRQGESLLKARGYKEATLWVLEGNIRARKFFEAMGFEPDGANREVDLGKPLQVVRYRKELKEQE